MKTIFYPYWRHACVLSFIFFVSIAGYTQCVKPYAGADTTVCKTTAQLKAPALGESWSFLSSSGGNTATISAAGLATDLTVTGQYKFVLSKSASCRDTIVVTKSNLILARLVDQFICPGQVLTFGFNGLSGYNYAWTTGATTPNISVSPLVTTDYVVTVTSSTNQCTYKDTVQVRVDPKPQAGKDTVFCTSTGQIAAAPNGETWSYVSASSGVTATPTIDNQGLITGLTQIGAYRFELKNAIGCTDTITVRRRSVTLPDIVRNPICYGTKVTFGFTNTTDFTYAWSTGATTPTITVKPDFSTDYIVTVKSLLTGCSIKDTITQIVNPKPFAAWDTIICGSTSKQLQLPLADQTWSFIAGSAVANVTATGLVTGMTARGNYFFQLQSAAGCKDTIEIKRDEVVFRAAISAATCNGTQVNNNGQIYLSNYSPTAKYAINTNPMALPTASIGLPTIPSGGVLVNNLANPVAPQNYTVRIFSSYIDCYKDTTLTLDAINCNNCIRPDAGTDIKPTCIGLTPITSVTLNATAVAGGTWTQIGTTPTVAVFSSITNAKATISGLLPGTYQFKWTAGVDCADLVDVVIPDCRSNCIRPDAGVNITKTVTSANIPTTVTLNATAVANGVWSQLGTTPTVASFSNTSAEKATVSNLIAGTYWFWWSVGTCQDSVEVTVVVESPCVKPNAGADITPTCTGLTPITSVALNATAAIGASWYEFETNPTIVITSSLTDPKATMSGLLPGVYQFIWAISETCRDTVKVTVPDCSNNCTKPNAGADITKKITPAELPTTSVMLNATATANGVWKQLGTKPSIVSFDNATAAKATASNLIEGIYLFQWSVGETVCRDTVKVTIVVEAPQCIKPYAGVDIQTSCHANGLSKTISLAATPMTGAKWTQLGSSPSTISFSDNTDPKSKVTFTDPGNYVLIWATNIGCKDTVLIGVPSCDVCKPSNAEAMALPATCNGSNILNNGKIALTNYASTDKYQYSIGTIFESNNAIPNAPSLILNNGIIANDLPNPSSQFQAYTIRTTTITGCTKDMTVLLLQTVCGCAPQPCIPSDFKIKKGN